jgi:hypothetical protein
MTRKRTIRAMRDETFPMERDSPVQGKAAYEFLLYEVGRYRRQGMDDRAIYREIMDWMRGERCPPEEGSAEAYRLETRLARSQRAVLTALELTRESRK